MLIEVLKWEPNGPFQDLFRLIIYSLLEMEADNFIGAERNGLKNLEKSRGDICKRYIHSNTICKYEKG